MISALIACPNRAFEPELLAALEQRRIEHVELNTRGAQKLVDFLLPDRADLLWLLAELTAIPGGPPRVITAHARDTGRRLKGRTRDTATWLAVAPDDLTPNPVPGQPPIRTRPFAYRQIHAWAGWAEQNDTEEA